jgi:glycine oxidase
LVLVPFLYNVGVKTRDVVVVGGGVIGLSLALELRRRGASVQVVERGEPGREASHAAAGMLAFCDPETLPGLRKFCFASARLYPEFVHVLEDESGQRVDFRRQGTIAFMHPGEQSPCTPADQLTHEELGRLEPGLDWDRCHAATAGRPVFLEEQTVDNRALVAAALKACKHRDVEIASGETVTGIEVHEGRAAGVTTNRTRFGAATVVNCAGAWAGSVGPVSFPTRPVKGQMLSVVMPHHKLLEHVVRTPEVYLVPRSDGRVLIGATVEEAGFDKRVEPDVIQRFHDAAARLLPEIGEARMLEAWAGLRPGTPDGLPILGATELPGYFVAAGHFRNGILLSAVTAKVMSEVVLGLEPSFDLAPFSPARFA